MINKKYGNECPAEKSQDTFMTSAEVILEQAKIILSHENKLNELENDLMAIRKEIEMLNSYYTVSGYVGLRGLWIDISKANMLERKATKLSCEYDYDIHQTDSSVNLYHVDILKEVFSEFDKGDGGNANKI